MYQPRFDISPYTLELVVKASELKTWISQAVVDVSWLPSLQRDTSARLAHSSTSIEGNPLTLPQVEALARGQVINASQRAIREVENALKATRWIWERKTGGDLLEEDLLRLHALLTRGTIDEEQTGAYKTRPNRVVDGRGRTVHTPPPPAQARLMTRALLSWINSSRRKGLHPVVVSAIAHHRLVSIHPFMDGNGRLSRALALWILCGRGFDTHHIFALDEYFESDRPRYYRMIQQARDLDDDLTHWIEYVGEGMVWTLERTRQRIEQLSVRPRGGNMLLTKRQEELLLYLRDRKRVRPSEFERAFRLTRSRLNQLLKPMVDAGLVHRDGQTRATSYRLA